MTKYKNGILMVKGFKRKFVLLLCTLKASWKKKAIIKLRVQGEI